MKCENCSKDIDGTFGSGRFCTRSCACTFVSRQNRELKNKKVSNTLTKEKIEKSCLICDSKFYVSESKKNQKYCTTSCSSLARWQDEDYRNSMTLKIQKRCSKNSEKERLRDIGRKGGFGNKGELKNGMKYSSNFEKECFEFLIENNIEFIPHKNIPNSSKISDIYFEKEDLYIELDGINREKKQKWLEKEYKYWLNKLEIYKTNNLKYKIIYNIKEFKRFILAELVYSD